MPKYDYRCAQCGHVYEKREGFDAPAVQECPRCSGTARRILTPPAIVFKGSGWYVTDSRKSSPAGSDGSSNSGAAAAKPDSSGTAAPKTETTKSEAAGSSTPAASESGASVD